MNYFKNILQILFNNFCITLFNGVWVLFSVCASYLIVFAACASPKPKEGEFAILNRICEADVFLILVLFLMIFVIILPFIFINFTLHKEFVWTEAKEKFSLLPHLIIALHALVISFVTIMLTREELSQFNNPRIIKNVINTIYYACAVFIFTITVIFHGTIEAILHKKHT